MHYDPIKQFLGRLFNRYASTRKLFYLLLDVLLLRSWHIRKVLKNYRPANKEKKKLTGA